MLGIDPAAERTHTAFWKKTVQGDFLSGSGPEVFISRPLAEDLSVSVGDTIRFSPGDMEHFSPFTVRGVYSTGIEQLDRGVAFCSLAAHPAPQESVDSGCFFEQWYRPRYNPCRIS